MAGISFDRAFADHFGSLHRFVRRRLGEDLADDVAAETFAIAYRRWNDFDQSRQLRPWLFGIAINVMRDHRRAEERRLRGYARLVRERAADHAESALETVPDPALQRRLAAALADLRAVDRDILVLYAWADFSYEEIASALGMPVGTVKSRLARVRMKIGNQLGDIVQVEK
jgi:RNA polymerase sigma factor (sigma-70 family)